MGLDSIYKELMAVSVMADDEKKAAASEAVFTKLNQMEIPTHFNWASEILEGIHVKERGDQPALLWVDLSSGVERRYTYAELAAEGNRCLNFLRAHGVSHGESVYMMVPSVPETWFSSIASIKGGMVAVPTADTMTVRELEYRFESYPPQAIFADVNSAKLIDEALKNIGATPKVKVVLGEAEGWKSYSDISKEEPTADAANTKSSDIILCFFTSGTTGLAKRVAHTAASYPVGHLSTANIIGLRPGDRHNNLSQPGWAKWAWSCLFSPLNMGATSTGFFYGSKFDTGKYLGAIAKYKVNVFCAPPTAWRAFMQLELEQFDFGALRESLSAGEPLNPEIIQRWKKYTGNEIRDFYGQTESTAMIGNPPWYKGKVVPGSFGRPSFLYDIGLADDQGNEITKADEVGHIVVKLDKWRALGLFDRYVGDEEKMKSVFVNNFYYTGDRASFDERGYWWFVGRADDVIKSSDYRVGPFEVESALIEHHAIVEAAVVGSPDPQRWQLVKGFVVLRAGIEPSRELALEVFQHCIEVLAKFKIPRIIEFVPELPKTISGKIRRVQLRATEQDKKEKQEKGSQEYFYQDFPELSSSAKKK